MSHDPIDTSDDWRTAVHEAGHAIVGIETSQKFRYVTIVPDQAAGSIGHVAFDHRRLPADLELTTASRVRWEAEIMRTLGGFFAEIVVFGTGCADEQWEADRTVACEFAQRMTGSSRECDAYLAWLQLRTENLLRRLMVRPVLDALAKALLQQGDVPLTVEI